MKDTWKHVEDIFQSAIEQSPDERVRFLNEACNGNESLRREVESLLASYQTGFMEQSPIEEFAEIIINSKEGAKEGVKPGEQIGSYKIISQIGAGGMGEVYLAEDSKLKRQVALKFLSAQVTADDEQLARFVREAQAVSALNHPNILTVYEIGIENDVHFIATEFIDGHTLRETFKNDELTLSKLLSYAVQTAEALTTAHEAGIIHRDIKPENIMIRRDGYVKILDFGLAKLTEIRAPDTDLEAQTQKLLKTSPGLIMGTACYMSPEQTRGLANVDARADVWSLGVVLFEMFAGRPPFEGNTVSDMIASILKTETPPLSQFVTDCPPELERIVTKALKKDRDERYQSMKDLALDLKSLRRDLEVSSKFEHAVAHKTGTNVTAVIPRQSSAVIPQLTAAATAKRFSLGSVLLILLGVTLVSGGFWWFSGRNGKQVETTDLKNSEIVSWSSSPGEIYSIGSFSPDGNEIAFTSTRSGTRNIWITATGGGEALQITKDEFKNEKPIWSPNAKELAFFSTRGNQAGIWRIPKFGGSPSLVSELDDASALLRRWSKENRIYYELKNDLFAVDLNTKETKKILDFGSKKINAAAISVSPDELNAAYITNDGEQWRVWTIPTSGDAPKQLAVSNSEIKNTVWHPDNKRIFYSSQVDGTFQIFVTDIYANAPTPITFADKDSFVLDAVLDASSNGTQILYGSAKEESDVWAVNPANSRESAVASDINSELWANASPDGKTIVYQSIRNLSQGDKLTKSAILLKQVNTNEQPVQLLADSFLPTWSPDGQKVAFVQVSGKKYQIGTIKASGGDQKLLSTSEMSPVSFTVLPYNRIQTNDFSWAPDSGKIAYVSDENDHSNIRIVNADGSGDAQLTNNDDPNVTLVCPLWSSDGRRIAFGSKTNVTGGKPSYTISITDLETKAVKVSVQKNLFLRLIGWSPSGKELIAASVERNPTVGLQKEISLLQIEIETGAIREISKLKDTYLYNIHLSPDKKTIAFASNQEGKDNVWLLPLGGGEAKKITGNNDPRIYFSSLSWSPDNGTIFFGKQSRYSLLSMLTNFK